MVTDSRWPITRFGVDLTRAWPLSVQVVGGALVRIPSFVKLPDTGGGQVGEPVLVTTNSYTVQPADLFIAITRDAPTATNIILPSVFNRSGALILIVDWSTNVTEHTITITPDGSETIMKAATWQMVSTDIQLASGTFFPSIDLNGWTTAP